MSRQRKNRRSPRVIQVREDGDRQAARIDRMISQQRSAGSLSVIDIKSTFDIGLTSGGGAATVTFTQVAGADDFVSMAQQFNEFKVKAMKFDVFHTNPSSSTPIVFSTLHSNFFGDPPSTWATEQSIVDAPDAMYLEPGSKKQSFYWNAMGTAENEFQDVNSFNNFGGLRWYVRPTTGGTGVVTAIVVMSAIVVFRGRH
jgi:hypothetical protein